MKQIKRRFKIYSPGGNDTALVFGIENDAYIRHLVNAYILRSFTYKNEIVVEQVGFVNEDSSSPHLMMSGGEFCGNATRSAAWYYLNGKEGEVNISVSGVEGVLRAGVNNLGESWAQMPVYKNIDSAVTEISNGVFLVKMEGIVHLVLDQEQSKNYLARILETDFFEENLKSLAFELISKNKLCEFKAAGVILLENKDGMMKMHPCVIVRNTSSYYETACGSGAIAVGLVQCFKKKTNGVFKMPLVQPSNQVITAVIEYSDGHITNAVISGSVKVYEKEYELNITIPEILPLHDWSSFPQKQDLFDLYRGCFEVLYEEVFTDADLESIFFRYFNEGIVLLGYDDSKKIIAFAAAVPLSKEQEIIDLIEGKNIVHDKAADWYYADIGVEKRLQGGHIGFVLCLILLETLLSKTSQRVFMRTRVDNQASIRLHEKIGFKIISGSQHDSPLREKKSGRKESDPSLLLEYLQ